MANNEVKVVMSLVDNLSNKMKGITGATGGLGGAFKDLTGFSMGAAGALAVVGVGLRAGIKLVKESVNETVAYNKTIREMTQVTGQSADTMSRVVQVADDWGISIDAVRTSLAFMNKTGVTPSIDNLARLADEYINTTDKAAFAEKAVKVLGRGYQTLIPLLALGGQGFRDAAAGIDKSLIATEAGMKASREYEVALDDLQDAATGLKYELGNELLPTLIKVTKGLNELITSNLNSADAADKLRLAHEKGLITDKELAVALKDLRTGTETVTQVTNKYGKELETLNQIEDYNEQVTRQETIARNGLNASVVTASSNMADLTDASGRMTEANNLAAQGLATLHGITDDLVNEAINGLNVSMVQTIQMQWAWALATHEIDQATYDLNMTMVPQLNNLEELGGLLSNGKITWDKYFQAVRDGKVTNDELIANLIATGMSAKDAAAYVATLSDKINGLQSKDVKLRVITEEWLVKKYGEPGYQHGANFVVPPGFPNDSFPMHVESGERVIVIPKGQAGNTTNNNFNVNLTGTGNAGRDVMSSIRLLEQLYG